MNHQISEPDIVNRRRYNLSLIREQSPFDEEATERIIVKYFKSTPSIVRMLYNKERFYDKKVLDIGCCYGSSLLYWGRESEGFDCNDKFLSFVHALGNKVHKGNAEDGFSFLGSERYDAIYTNNLIEHIVAPHLFLVRLFALLKPGGVLAIGHPVVAPQPFRFLLNAIGKKGHLAVEHINFYTPRTARLCLERSGFHVEKQYFSSIAALPLLSSLTVPFGHHCLSICRKIDGYKYHPKRAKEFDPEWAGDLAHIR